MFRSLGTSQSIRQVEKYYQFEIHRISSRRSHHECDFNHSSNDFLEVKINTFSFISNFREGKGIDKVHRKGIFTKYFNTAR